MRADRQHLNAYCELLIRLKKLWTNEE